MSAKNLVVKPISADLANDVIKRLHYSGGVVRNSQLHMGVYYAGKLEGAMQFGPSLDKRKMLGLVEGTAWNGFLELNRMAFSEALPPNSESRAIAVAMRLIKKHAPHVEWVISFADGTQCGDGTIYRASGFVLTAIKESDNLARMKDGSTLHKMTLHSNPLSPRPEAGGLSFYDVTKGKYDFKKYVDFVGGQIIPGFQLRYIYFINRSAKERLTVPIVPFSQIDKVGARMYRGARVESVGSDTSPFHGEEDGANPISTLHQDSE